MEEMDYQVINHTKELAGARTHEQGDSWHTLQWVLPSPSEEQQPLCINSKTKQELIIVQLLDIRPLQQNKGGKGNTSVHVYLAVYLFSLWGKSRGNPLCSHFPSLFSFCLYSHSLKSLVLFSDQGLSQAFFNKEIEELTELTQVIPIPCDSYTLPPSCQAKNVCWHSLCNSVINNTAPHHPEDQ